MVLTDWKSICMALVPAITVAGSLPCLADEIAVGGIQYQDVYVRTSGSMYYIQTPDDGKVITADIETVDLESVKIAEDEAERAAILTRWKESKARREEQEAQRREREASERHDEYRSAFPRLSDVLQNEEGLPALVGDWRDDRGRLWAGHIYVRCIPPETSQDAEYVAMRRKAIAEELAVISELGWPGKDQLAALGTRFDTPVTVQLPEGRISYFREADNDEIAVVQTGTLDLSEVEIAPFDTDPELLAKKYPFQLALLNALAESGKIETPFQINAARPLLIGHTLIKGSLGKGTWEIVFGPKQSGRISVFYEFSKDYGAGFRGIFEKVEGGWKLTSWSGDWIS